MARNFFRLQGSFKKIDQAGFYALIATRKNIHSYLYEPDRLSSNRGRIRTSIRDKQFKNVSFRSTQIERIEFNNCEFIECLFIATTFNNCRFTSCKFTDCNPHRIDFERCFVDPKSFENCIIGAQYANIGVYLFQELLRNSRQQAQPDFSDDAQFLFRRWQRYQAHRAIEDRADMCGKFVEGWRFASLWLFEKLAGSGVRLSRLALSAALTLAAMSLINWAFAGALGLEHKNQQVGTFVESLYFSTIVTTTVGFGDVVPNQPLGQLVVSLEALIGLVFFAMLTSTIYRRASS